MTDIQCELCSSATDTASFEVPHTTGASFNNAALLCSSCRGQIEQPDTMEPNHWHCLRDSIWSENPAVKVLAWRVLSRFSAERWAQDLLDQLYMEEDLLEWAKAGQTQDLGTETSTQTRDSNGTVLANEDSVILIKDLDVKGAGFTAKRGTLVKNISLTEDPLLIEGKINGTQIVLKTQFLKKAT